MLRSTGSMRSMLSMFSIVFALISSVACSTTGLSLDTSYFLATSFEPSGTLANLLPSATGNGWTVQMWLTYQPGTPLPARTRTLFAQNAIACCASAGNNFQYSIVILATGVVRVQVTWYSGSLTLDSTVPLAAGGTAADKWTHLSVVFRENKGVSIYIDGDLDNTSLLMLLPDDVNLLAFQWDEVSPFVNNGTLVLFDDTGLIDEIRFLQTALSSSSIEKSHCMRKSGNAGDTTLRYSFDSNLASDGSTTSQYLNTTFDMHTTGSNHLRHVSDIPAAALVQQEPKFCSANDMSPAFVAIMTIVLALCLLFLLVWVIVVPSIHSSVSKALDAKSQFARPRTLGGTDAYMGGGGGGGGGASGAGGKAVRRKSAAK